MKNQIKSAAKSELITRSAVPSLDNYNGYKKYLQFDFIYSCAYCTMSEAEATAIRFTIDHYESRKHFPDLENVYSNLMYCCEECNLRKGPRVLSQKVRELGYRLFRPDNDVRSDHFELSGQRVRGKTKIGEYTIDAVALNRSSLRRLREIRERLTSCQKFISEGVLGLRRYPIDSLPKDIRGRAYKIITRTVKAVETTSADIDEVLRAAAISPLSDQDDDPKIGRLENRERLERLRQVEGLSPEAWREKG